MTALYKIIIWTSFLVSLRIVYYFTPGENLELGTAGIFIGLIRSCSDAFILSLPILLAFSKNNHRKAALTISYIWISIISIVFLSNIWYARHYGTPVHYTDLLLIDNLKDLDDDIADTIKLKDFLSVIPIWAALGFISLKQKAVHNRKRYIITTGIVLSALIFVWSARHNYEGAGFSRTNILKHYGIFHLLRYDINANLPVDYNDIASADKYLYENSIINSNKEAHRDTINTNNNTRYNLIIILLESFASWPIEKTINGLEITPFINDIVNTKGTGYWPNMVSQTKDGRSSDAQLMINTGLLPVKVGAVAGMYANHTYPSLPEALSTHGYTSHNFICDGAYFWNQKATSMAYGFDYLHDKHIWQSEKNLSDSMLFEKVKYAFENKIIQQPFYSQIVTISSHCPYNENNTPDKKSPFLKMNIKNEEMAYFLSAIHYTDKCLGNFIKWIKKNNIDDNTVIVITGDHEDITLNDNAFIPFIMIHPNRILNKCNDIVAQSDIYPTLLKAMNINDYYFRGLGFDMLEYKSPGMAISRNGVLIKNKKDSIKTDSIEKTEKDLRHRWNISDIIIRSNFFRNLSL